MSNRLFLSLALLLLPLTLSQGAQTEMSDQSGGKGPSFHVDAVNLATPGHPEQSRLSLFMELVYDELQFVKTDTAYKASYEVTIIIYDKDGEQVDGKVFRENVSASTFDMTNKRTLYNQSNQIFDLEPGSYKYDVSILDSESNSSGRIRQNIDLRDYSKNELALSDIIWVSELIPDSLGSLQSIRPQVSDRLKGLSNPAYAYFEIYNPAHLQNVQVAYELAQEHSKKALKAVYRSDISQEKSIGYFPIKVDSLNHGHYRLTVQAQAGKAIAKVKKDFFIRWSSLPANARDLDEAIDQTRYIAGKDEWKKLKNAKGEQRLQEYKKFWLHRDPTPGTEINEAMDAHYTRIEYANQNFRAMQNQGWRTDMGMVYVILGSPDDVERNAYPRYSKPYEIWFYYRYNTDFVFLDSTGFGDYRLETPYSIYEFQRLIDR